MRYKRARLEIIYDILLYVKNCDGAKPTNILQKANLSVPLLRKYLKMLLADNLIFKVTKNNRVLYKLTKKGIGLINLIKKLDKVTHAIELSSYRRIKFL